MTSSVVSSRSEKSSERSSLRTVDLRGPAGRLEALLNEGVPDSPLVGLVCHPHPMGGGTMHNKVVYHVMKVLNAPEWGLGWPVLRFNFRGTGLSEGQPRWPRRVCRCNRRAQLAPIRIQIARRAWSGFSFGAAMALAASCGTDAPIGNRRKPPRIGRPWPSHPGIRATHTIIRPSPNAPCPSYFSAAITIRLHPNMNCNRWLIPPPTPKAWCSSPARTTSLPVASSRCKVRSRLG